MRYLSPGDNSQGNIGFGVFLAGIGQETGKVYLRVFLTYQVGFIETGAGLLEQAASFLELTAMHGANGVGRESNNFSGYGKGLLAGSVSEGQQADGVGSNVGQVLTVTRGHYTLPPAWLMASTRRRAAASGSGARPTAAVTQTASAPASITGPTFSALIPPIATRGTLVTARA